MLRAYRKRCRSVQKEGVKLYALSGFYATMRLDALQVHGDAVGTGVAAAL